MLIGPLSIFVKQFILYIPVPLAEWQIRHISISQRHHPVHGAGANIYEALFLRISQAIGPYSLFNLPRTFLVTFGVLVDI